MQTRLAFSTVLALVDDCARGGGSACDSEYGSGCDTICDEFSCYTCCYGCSGDSCEQTCDF